MLIFAAEKDLVAMRTTAIERELQIPILDTSELQIRWNGDKTNGKPLVAPVLRFPHLEAF